MNTVGKRLQQGRLKKKLSVEEAARATKVRAERILDLENDTFANFPNLAYAKSFLVIYAKYLEVDVSDFVESFTIASPVGRNDYQYLSNAPEARPTVRRSEGRATKPMLIVAGIGVCVMVFAGFIMYLVINAQRLGLLDQPGAKKPATNLFAASTPSHNPAPVEIATPLPMSTPLLPGATPALALAVPAPVISPRPQVSPANLEVRRAVVADPAPSPSPTQIPSASAQPRRENEVILQPLRKTWVTVREGEADAPPVFEDWLYPDAKGLTLHGDKFWISVGEKGAVEIKKNGVAINYDTSVAIQ